MTGCGGYAAAARSGVISPEQAESNNMADIDTAIAAPALTDLTAISTCCCPDLAMLA